VTKEELIAEKEAVLAGREPLKYAVAFWQSRLADLGKPGRRRQEAIEKVAESQKSLRESKDRLREINRLLVEMEDRKKQEAHATFSDFFLQVVKDAVPKEKFDGWMRIAGIRFQKHYELMVDE
jgi:hypothetical protein